MPRRPRSDLAGFPLHLIQRGNNRSACFFVDTDRTAYLHWLGRYAARLEIAVHAWVLMSNHVHLLLTPPSPAHASRLMQALGRRYVRYINRAHNRSGTLWEGRFRACAVHAEDYLLACMRYIELNPVRAEITSDASGYSWSSHRGNAFGQSDALLTEHSLYTGLGATSADRQAAYLDLFRVHLDETAPNDIRIATAAGHLLARERSRQEIETVRGLHLGPAPRGRPKKTGGTASGAEQLGFKL